VEWGCALGPYIRRGVAGGVEFLKPENRKQNKGASKVSYLGKARLGIAGEPQARIGASAGRGQVAQKQVDERQKRHRPSESGGGRLRSQGGPWRSELMSRSRGEGSLNKTIDAYPGASCRRMGVVE